MHACELLPVAAIVADSSTSLLRQPILATSHMHDYWSASRERLDCWVRAFAKPDEGDPAQPPIHLRLPAVIEEVLLSEVLTRVWAAATSSHDAVHNADSLAPVTRSVLLGHQESRNRALLAMLKMHQSQPTEGRRLNVLRQKCERWTDMLLAYFPLSADVERMTFDLQRCKDFATDLHREGKERDAMQSLTMASLEATAQQASVSAPVNADLNSRIAQAVLGCVPPDAFDATGLFSLMWQNRIESATDSTMGLVEQLLSLECPNILGLVE